MREKIRMNSTAGTGHFYTTDKNKRTMPDKLEMKKYDPVARKHVVYKEGRSSKRSKRYPKAPTVFGAFFCAKIRFYHCDASRLTQGLQLPNA